MIKLFLIFIIIFPSFVLFGQSKTEKDIDIAYQNAKKGVYWALSNIPEKKSKLNEDLIANDILYSSVKLYKEVNGIKVESVGYYKSDEVTINIYKSNDNLIKEGYLKKKSSDEN